MQRSYLDHAATTPLDPRVAEAMLACLTHDWGNPSSIYREGQQARAVLDGARRTVAEILGAQPGEITFTGGGSESDNLAIRGAVALSGDRRHLVTTAIEHHAILHTFERLAQEGFEVTVLPVDGEGFVSPEQVAGAVRADTALVSVMLVNNEIGTVEPVAEIARAVRQRNAATLIHSDAVQAAGLLPVNVDALGVDLLTVAAHKFYGPKGTGVLYARRGTRLQAQILGGSQEHDLRAGTENVAGAVGLATALRLAHGDLGARSTHCARLRDRLLDGVPRRIPHARVTGPLDRSRRAPHNASFAFAYIEGESLLLLLDLGGIAASSGSACTSGSLEPSHVLTAAGVPEEYLRASLRLSVGHENTDAEIDRLLAVLPGHVERLRALSPLGPGTPQAAMLDA